MNNIAIVVIRSPQSLPENMVVYRVLSHKKICARGPTHHHNLAVAEKFGPSSPESIVAGLTVRKPDVLRTFLHVIIDTVAVEHDLTPYIAETRDCGDSQEDSFNRRGIDRDAGRSVRRRRPYFFQVAISELNSAAIITAPTDKSSTGTFDDIYR